MITVKGISNQDFNEKKCLLRLDLNIPISENGQILDDTRIRESKPSIDYLLEQNTKVIIVSHMGRPKGKYSSELSFENLLSDFEKILKRKIVLVPFSDQEDALKIINSLDFGTLFLLDNNSSLSCFKILSNPVLPINCDGSILYRLPFIVSSRELIGYIIFKASIGFCNKV